MSSLIVQVTQQSMTLNRLKFPLHPKRLRESVPPYNNEPLIYSFDKFFYRYFEIFLEIEIHTHEAREEKLV